MLVAVRFRRAPVATGSERLPLAGRRDPELFAVLRDGAARDVESRRLEPLRDVVVGQWARYVLLLDDVLDAFLDVVAGLDLAAGGLGPADEEGLQRVDPLRG